MIIKLNDCFLGMFFLFRKLQAILNLKEVAIHDALKFVEQERIREII